MAFCLVCPFKKCYLNVMLLDVFLGNLMFHLTLFLRFILWVPVALVHSLLCCKYTSIYASVLLLMDTWAVSVDFALRNINP